MTERLSVGFLSTVHPHPWDPTKGVFNQGLLSSLAESGANIDALVPVPWTERRGKSVRLAVPYRTHFPTWWYVPRIGPLQLAAQMRLSTLAIRRRIQKPHIVLSYWTDPDGTVAAAWAAQMKVPFVQMVGGSDVLVLGSNPKRRARMLETLRLADHVLTIGHGLRQTLEEWGIDLRRVSSFQRGVDHSRFYPGPKNEARERLGLPTDRPILAWAGRLVDIKGVDVLLAALDSPALLALNPLVLLIGEGPNRAALESVAARSLPADTVRFVGRMSHDSLPEWYRAADLMVLPSHSEGVPNVLLESMACGTGFVASAVGGIPDLAKDPVRQLVPAGDVAALSAALLGRLRGEPMPVADVPDRSASAAKLLDQLRTLVAGKALR